MNWTKICFDLEVSKVNKKNYERIIKVDGKLKNNETSRGGITRTRKENKKDWSFEIQIVKGYIIK